MQTFSAHQARWLALRAQGLPRPQRPLSPRAVLARLGAVQIDSVNTVSRAHYLPFFSRIPGLSRTGVDRLAGGQAATEYWAHEACLIDAATRPLFGWRMDRYREYGWGFTRSIEADHPGLMDDVELEVAVGGPGTARQLRDRLGHDHQPTGDHWGWNWSGVKQACEALFWGGRLVARHRNASFERIYDLPERALGAQDPVAEREAVRRLVVRAVTASGVADLRTVRDYFRLPADLARQAVDDALVAGEIESVSVTGWRRPAFVPVSLRSARRPSGACLLGPFDSLLWDRERVATIFGFHHRIEIYTPADQRRYGYYVLPFLLDDALVARADLKADRENSQLLVRGASAAHDAPAATVARLAEELHLLAGYLSLASVRVTGRGGFTTLLGRNV